MINGKSLWIAGVLITAASVAAVQAPAAASASSGTRVLASQVSCNVVTSHCESATITAPNNSLTYWVDPGGTWNGCSWRVKDVNTGVAVASGRTGAGRPDSGSRSGLHGTYRIELWNCSFGAVGILYN